MEVCFIRVIIYDCCCFSLPLELNFPGRFCVFLDGLRSGVELLTMKFHYKSSCGYQTRRGGALAVLLVLLFPVLLPSLFSPLSHASPSKFSVCFFSFLCMLLILF